MRRACSFFAFAALAVTLLAACGGGSEEDFQTDVVAARNRTDAALEQIVRAKSIDDLLERMRIAATEIRGAATDVRDADAPDGMADDADALEQALRALSDEIVGTVTTFEQNPEAVAMASGFDFASWNQVNARLAALRRQGIDVPPLERQKPPEPAP